VIRLADTVDIAVPPQRVWKWLDDMPRHYRDWHPSHRDCRYVRGDHLLAGAVLCVQEELHGRQHALTLHADVAEPDRELRFRGRGVRGAFLLEPSASGTRFTAQLDVGTPVPGIGGLVDVVLRRALAARLRAIQEHMREEGRNPKRLLEAEAQTGRHG
jgi:hypothetical protein